MGSNNISLNNKKGKKAVHAGHGHGHGASTVCSPKAPKKTMQIVGSPIASPSPMSSPNSSTQLRPPTPQPVMQQVSIIYRKAYTFIRFDLEVPTKR